MSKRPSIDHEAEFAIWTHRSAAAVHQSRRILIGHRDKAIGESLALLLSIKGYEAIYAGDLSKLQTFLKCWKPHAVLLDTRLESDADYHFTRTLRAEHDHADILLLAMSNIWPLDPVGPLKDAGFDGHCRRPCSLWRVVDILEGYFALA